MQSIEWQAIAKRTHIRLCDSCADPGSLSVCLVAEIPFTAAQRALLWSHVLALEPLDDAVQVECVVAGSPGYETTEMERGGEVVGWRDTLKARPGTSVGQRHKTITKRNEPGGQSSPGILHSGQHASKGFRQIPQSASLTFHFHTETACQPEHLPTTT